VRYVSHSSTRVGTRRSSNQDVVAVDEQLGVYILCDGMGGTAGGGIAASLAAKSCMSYLAQHASTLRDISAHKAPSTQLIELAQSAVEFANHAVHAHTQEHPELGASGTTIALLIVAGTYGVCAHVGDSRVYAFRDKQFLQLTKDHSLAQDLIDRGVLDKANVATFRFKHVLSRAVGLLPAVSVDTLHFEIVPGDRFVLASDGVSSADANAALENSRTPSSPAELLETITSLAHEGCSEDDISAIIVEASDAEINQRIHAARAEELVLKTKVLRDVYLFQPLDPRNILRIVDASVLIACRAHEVIVAQGEPEVSLYIILDGTFRVEIDDQMIAELSRGNHFGEMALLTCQPRSATVRASTNGRVLRLAAGDFHKFVQEHPQDGIRMISALARELSERLRLTNQLHSQPSNRP
jgi:serine/threonine protein phosphatase PrpC/CRP-like cAMP-binding protein